MLVVEAMCGGTSMASMTLDYIKQVVDRLPIEEQRSLLNHLNGKLSEAAGQEADQAQGAVGVQGQIKSLRGAWKEYFPEDVDIDAILYEIRHEWEKELEEIMEE
jgi:hypothetical protein